MKKEILNVIYQQGISFDKIIHKIEKINYIINIMKVKQEIIVVTYDNKQTDLFQIISQIRNIDGVKGVSTNFNDIPFNSNEIEFPSVLHINKPIEIKKKSSMKICMCIIFICILISLSIYLINMKNNDSSVFPTFLDEIEEKEEFFDPTHNEMCNFINTDLTDLNVYNDTYVCQDFCFDVIRNAKEHQFKVGFVTFSNHSIICFNTTDKGLYFIEPQVDYIFSEEEMDEMITRGYYGIDGVFGTDDCINITSYNIDWSR